MPFLLWYVFLDVTKLEETLLVHSKNQSFIEKSMQTRSTYHLRVCTWGLGVHRKGYRVWCLFRKPSIVVLSQALLLRCVPMKENAR